MAFTSASIVVLKRLAIRNRVSPSETTYERSVPDSVGVAEMGTVAVTDVATVRTADAETVEVADRATPGVTDVDAASAAGVGW